VLCTRARARSLATKMISFRLGLYVVLPKSSAGSINFIWTTYLGKYHNCSTFRSLTISGLTNESVQKIANFKGPYGISLRDSTIYEARNPDL
jgi:hypothetical protein